VDRRLAPLLDTVCVLVLVVIGTRNHESANSVIDVLAVGAPFWIALGLGWVLPGPRRHPLSTTAAASVWLTTVAAGMALRNLAFGRGTALPFVIVAALFLFATMFGWRALARRRTDQPSVVGSENSGRN